MAENTSRFIKSVIFGGYDRTDTDKHIESLYLQIFELEGELRESKQMLERLREGTEEEKAHEAVLAAERAKLSEAQAESAASAEKVKKLEEDNKLIEQELASLHEENEKLKASYDEVNSELTALKAGDEAAVLGAVFIEAQKSKEMLIKAAQDQAARIKTDSEKLAENILADADNKAAKVIYDAEKRAAEISADALSKSEQMKAASQNLKASMLQEVSDISSQINALKAAVDSFESEGRRLIEESEKILNDTESDLKKGGVPVFTVPADIKPRLPESPELKPVDFNVGEANKRSKELDKLKAMAAALDGEKGSQEDDKKEVGSPADAPKDGQGGGKKGGVNLAELEELAKQAEALSGGQGGQDSSKAPDKDGQGGSGDGRKGGLNLADLAKQAEALSGGSQDGAKPSGGSGDGKKGGLNLADLAKQAEALSKK
ncbi:MAG: hypothetical protein J1F11_03205 [Oscillospiraceae bacterium]|nr:hypothetical protein [Oscillospiraceae bacterium]